jgi:hypothetical protein
MSAPRRLSARERQVLAQMSEALHAEDPQWAAQFAVGRGSPPPAARLRAQRGSVRAVAVVCAALGSVIGLAVAADASAANRLAGLAFLAAFTAITIAFLAAVAGIRWATGRRIVVPADPTRGRPGGHSSPV